MSDPVQRLVFYGQLRPDATGGLSATIDQLHTGLVQRVATGEILTLSLFRWRRALFLYYECPGTALAPSELVGQISPALKTWPGEDCSRVWMPMMDIFHYNRPASVEHWRRATPPEARTARVIYIRPEMVSSYIFYHYQMQEEKPGGGDKYGQVSICENLLFFYMEKPATIEAAPHKGKLENANTPPNWHEVMFPHFQPWDDEKGEELWRPIECVFGV